MGKVHGSLARAGKVRGQTPKVEKKKKNKQPRGRAYQRIKYQRRFISIQQNFEKKKSPNSQNKN
jgi:small subunit ribosomal protein S30e